MELEGLTMTIGVGGSNVQDELKSMQLLSENIENITEEEYSARIQKATVLMQQHNVDAIFLVVPQIFAIL